jgi:putative RNA 2'-phosphotransferase
MAARKIKQQRDSLARFLAYVLGHRPDEFGLYYDQQGFVPLKELLKALSEEEGWRHVRQSHIEELLKEPGAHDLEMDDQRIRLTPGQGRLELGPPSPVEPPSVLYHACRRKGYPVILKNGLQPLGREAYVPLSDSKEMALRIGRRRDPDPVLLTVHAGRAAEQGVAFHRQIEHVFLVEELPPAHFTGPPLPEEKPAAERKKKKEPVEPARPGSVFVDPYEDLGFARKRGPDKSKKRKKGDEPDWKRAARKERRRRRNEDT